MDALEDVIWALDQLLLRASAQWIPDQPDESVYHGWALFPTLLFAQGLEVARPHLRGTRFMDVGCGAGFKVALAGILGFGPMVGIERHPPYAEMARTISPHATVIEKDLFEVPWFDADLVYMFHLAVDEAENDRVERHVAERVDPGTVLFFAHGSADLGDLAEPIGRDLWRRRR